MRSTYRFCFCALASLTLVRKVFWDGILTEYGGVMGGDGEREEIPVSRLQTTLAGGQLLRLDFGCGSKADLLEARSECGSGSGG